MPEPEPSELDVPASVDKVPRRLGRRSHAPYHAQKAYIIMVSLRVVVTGLLISFTRVALADSAESDTLVVQNIARAYGSETFGNIAKIRFTFNLQRDKLRVQRSWEWEPKPDRVTYVNPPDQSQPVSYRRADLPPPDTGRLRGIDKLFVNDQYWLLFPLHLAWDKGIQIAVDELKALPIGYGFCRRVTITYPTSGGYTPGDMYRMYIDEQYHIVEWEYHKGDSVSTTIATRWQKHRWAGPLLISLERPGPDKSFHIWFTRTAVMLRDIDIIASDTVIEVKRLPLWYRAQ